MPEDFRCTNLRGRSFKGLDITGRDFSSADIRGTKFDNAVLKNVNFSKAQAGLQNRWKIIWASISFLLAVLAGLTCTFAGTLARTLLTYDNIKQFREFSILPGIVVLLILSVFFIVTIRKGIVAALRTVGVAIVLAVALTVAEFIVGSKLIVGAVAIVLALVIAAVLIAAGVGAIAVNLTNTVFGNVGVVVAMVLIVAVAAAGFTTPVLSKQELLGTALLVAVAVALLSNYISWRAIAIDKELAWIRKIAVAVAARSGTSFRGADLTDADFTKATLKNTDFSKANVTRTCWLQAQKLDLAHVGTTYLEKPQVRQLVTTGKGQDKNFDRLDLRGINLCGANLVDASFVGADLSEANLQNANLSRAKLVQTQLDRTDLTGACLTGACIEDWGITNETKLDRVECEYVFMQLPTKDDPDRHRKPDNWKEFFKVGEFGDFIKPIVETLDLYHNQGVDPRAIAISFKRLTENHPEAELEIVAMEKRGQDKFLLRAKTAEGANRSELSLEYFEDYNRLKALSKNDLIFFLAQRDGQIRSLETAFRTVSQKDSIHIQGNVGAFVGGDNTGVAGQDLTGVAGRDISGTVTNTIGQLQESSAPEAPKLADLLKQLQAAIEAETNLTPDDKAEALEQVKTLAEAGQKPKEGAMQKSAKTALTMLRGITSVIPTTASLVEASSKLLPLITQIFGLG